MKAVDEFIIKTKVQIKEMLEKGEVATRDKQELYRDLATFEFNFTKLNKQEFITRIKDLETRTNVIAEKFDKAKMEQSEETAAKDSEKLFSDLMEGFLAIFDFKENEKIRSYNNSKNFSLLEDDSESLAIDTIKANLYKGLSLTPLTASKKKKKSHLERASVANDDYVKTISSYMTDYNCGQVTAKMMLGKLLNYKETMSNFMMNISGLYCLVTAKYVNGRIITQVSPQWGTKVFKLDFAPLKKFYNK